MSILIKSGEKKNKVSKKRKKVKEEGEKENGSSKWNKVIRHEIAMA